MKKNFTKRHSRRPVMERYNSFTHSETSGESDFPGGLVVKTPPSNAGGTGSVPSWGMKVPHVLQHSQRKEL